MKLSIVIPAHNEEACIEKTIRDLYEVFQENKIDHEILVVNDNCTDGTESLLVKIKKEISTLKYIDNPPPNGFGLAVRKGLENFTGDVVGIVMADGSDSPEDIVRFYQQIQKGYDCVFGSRFIRGASTTAYPWFKLFLNRGFNTLIRIMFGLKYNDITNAFKMYRAGVIPGLMPLLSHHFNLTVELPLKAIIRGYSYTVIPNSWKNRKAGTSKLKIKEMGSRYFFILIYCFIEKWLSKGDYRQKASEIKE